MCLSHVRMWSRGYSLLGTVDELVLVGALVAGTHPLVLPQSLGVLVEFLKVNRREKV